MKLKCAIFDFDGTLFDSMHIWESVAEIYLRSLDIVPKPSLRDEVREMCLHQSATYMREEYDLSLSVEQIMEGINQTVEDFYLYQVLPKAGVIPVLERLYHAKIPMCIATATDRYQIEAALKRCGMAHYFDEIFTCSEVGHGKDEPAIYRKAMACFDVDRSTTIVFEDAYHAVRTAKKDGFVVAAVFDQSEKRQEEIRELADFCIADYEHMEALWERLEG